MGRSTHFDLEVSVALQGTLDTFALADVLRLLSATKKSGKASHTPIGVTTTRRSHTAESPAPQKGTSSGRSRAQPTVRPPCTCRRGTERSASHRAARASRQARWCSRHYSF